MKRILLAIVATFMLAGCGGGDDSSDTGGVATVDDLAMNEQMTDCVRKWMVEAALTPEVDTATTDELAAANRVYLEDCGSQRITDHDVASGYHCTGDGCYDENQQGYSWRTVAADWACENNHPMCALAE